MHVMGTGCNQVPNPYVANGCRVQDILASGVRTAAMGRISPGMAGIPALSCDLPEFGGAFPVSDCDGTHFGGKGIRVVAAQSGRTFDVAGMFPRTVREIDRAGRLAWSEARWDRPRTLKVTDGGWNFLVVGIYGSGNAGPAGVFCQQPSLSAITLATGDVAKGLRSPDRFASLPRDGVVGDGGQEPRASTESPR